MKPKDEGWILVIGETETSAVVAMKRVTCSRGRRSTSASLAFFAPELPCRVVYTLYVMSDSYLGLDQQFDIHLEVIPALETAVNGDIFDDLQLIWVSWNWLNPYVFYWPTGMFLGFQSAWYNTVEVHRIVHVCDLRLSLSLYVVSAEHNICS